MLVAICGLLIGATLGTRLRVFVLLPVSLFGAGVVAVVSVFNGATLLLAAGDIAVWTVCLQMGYLGGLLTRYCLAAARLAPARPVPSTAARS